MRFINIWLSLGSGSERREIREGKWIRREGEIQCGKNLNKIKRKEKRKVKK